MSRVVDQVTLLYPLGRKYATKRAYLTEAGEVALRSYDRMFKHNCRVVQVGGITGLSRLLTKLEGLPQLYAIRGEPHPDVDLNKPVLRRHLRDDEGIIWFREPEGGRRYVMLDFDKVELPFESDLVNAPEEAIEHLVSMLPGEFSCASYHWQLSSSAGLLKDNCISAHVWFWFTRPVAIAELKSWVKLNSLPIDTALFNPTQPHYTAAPYFGDVGEEYNPLRRRSGFVRCRDDEVVFPEIPMPEVPLSAASQRRSTGGGGRLSNVHGMEGWFEVIGDGDGQEGFYQPIRSITASFAASRTVARIERECGALKERIRNAIADAPKRPGRAADIRRYSSDKFLDDHINSATRRFALDRPAPPHFKHVFDGPEEATRQMRAHVDTFLSATLNHGPNEAPPQIGIKASAGTGKTLAAVEGIAGLEGVERLHVAVFAPTHALCDEWAARLLEAVARWDKVMRVQVIRGRSYGAPEEPMCRKWQLAEDVARRGMPVGKTLCRRKRANGAVERCEHFDSCPYIRQFVDTGPAVRIWPTVHIALTPPDELPSPDFAVIDERFWPSLVKETSFGLDRLVVHRDWQPHLLKDDWLQAPNSDAMMSSTDIARVLSWDARDALEAGQPLKKALSDLGWTKAHLEAAAKAELTARSFCALHPGQSTEQQHIALANSPDSEALTFWRLWNLLAEEWDRLDDAAIRIELRRDWPEPGTGERRHRVFLHWRRETWLRDVPVLAIDADLDERIARIFLPHLEVHEVAVERRARVVQASDRAVMKHSLLTDKGAADRLSEVQSLIDALAWSGKRMLIVASKPIAAKLAAPEGSEVTHFGALRGVDKWKDLDTVLVVGREQPAVDAIEGLMRALFWDRLEPLLFVQADQGGRRFFSEERRGYRMRDGELRGATVRVHPDKDGQRLLEQIRECESAQAIDRLRLIHGAEKRVFVLSNVVLDLTVDAMATWSDLMPSRAVQALVKHGALPLTAAEAARCCPELWGTKNAAKLDLKRSGFKEGQTPNGKEGQTPNYTLLGDRPSLVPVTYRRPGQRGWPHRALIDARRSDPRQTLEQLVGSVSLFMIEEPATAEPTGAAHSLSRWPQVELTQVLDLTLAPPRRTRPRNPFRDSAIAKLKRRLTDGISTQIPNLFDPPSGYRLRCLAAE